jgi:hypothetical protein
MFGSHRDAFRKIKQEPARSRYQVFQGNHLQRTERKIHADGPTHGLATGTENIDAQCGRWIDQLQHGFAAGRERMDVPEQEILRQRVGNAAEPTGNEIQVVQGTLGAFKSKEVAVELVGKSAGERQVTQAMPCKFVMDALGSRSVGGG